MNRDVFIGYPLSETNGVASHFHVSLMEIGLTEPHVGGHAAFYSGPKVAGARNLIVGEFLKSECPWLWFVDTDMVVERDVIQRMLAAADSRTRPVLSALAFAHGNGETFPSIYRRSTLGDYEPVYDYPRDELVKVEAVGAACLLIHRSVLRAITPGQWFADVSEGPHGWGHDIEFCRRVWQAGHSVHVHTGIEAGHWKGAVINQATYDRDRSDANV